MANIGEKGLSRQECIDVAAQLEAQGFILMGEKVAVIRDPDQERTAGGIIIPDGSATKPLRGTVVAVGAGCVTDDGDPIGVRVGDRVTFTKYRGTVHQLPLVNGDDVVHVESVHVGDIFFVWRH